MIQFDYLSKGLNAIARAHHIGPMAGHLGAAVVAGYFIGEQRPDLPPEVFAGIEDDLERVIRGESVFGAKRAKNPRLTDPELFEPFPKQAPNASLIDAIAEALEMTIDAPRQSGHNVIFASIAIRALKEHPELSTPSVVEGITKLITLFKDAPPGNGYYGKEKGRIYGDKISLLDDDGTPPYTGIEEMATAVLDEVIAQKPTTHRQGYGGLVHVINHAAAIADLSDYGYGELVPTAIKSHRQHLRLWRNLPNVADERGPTKVSKFTPHAAAYWTSGQVPYDRALLTHRVKTMFGFDELAQSADDGQRKARAYDKLRHLM